MEIALTARLREVLARRPATESELRTLAEEACAAGADPRQRASGRGALRRSRGVAGADRLRAPADRVIAARAGRGDVAARGARAAGQGTADRVAAPPGCLGASLSREVALPAQSRHGPVPVSRPRRPAPPLGWLHGRRADLCGPQPGATPGCRGRARPC